MKTRILYFLFSLFLFSSCVKEEQFDNSVTGNIEALWKVMDEHYCFFDYKKQQLGVDWDEVHTRYRAQANDKLSSYQQFELLCSMISELRDGHVNLTAAFDVGRNWSWKEDYPANFSDTLQRAYLGTDYRIAGPLRYRILDDNIGYVYCGSFEAQAGDGNLDHVFSYLAECRAIILDVRNNGGGKITAAEALAARFTNEDLLVGYMQHKTGPDHNDFSEPQQQNIAPSAGIRWQKPVVILTNRAVYSAANEFVKYMKAIIDHRNGGVADSYGAIVGDTTGGGAGMPFSSELPNGWAVRFSACPMFDKDGNSTEHGITPHHIVNQTDEDFLRNKDTLIEFARSLCK